MKTRDTKFWGPLSSQPHLPVSETGINNSDDGDNDDNSEFISFQFPHHLRRRNNYLPLIVQMKELRLLKSISNFSQVTQLIFEAELR